MKWIEIEKADIIRVTHPVTLEKKYAIEIRPITEANITDGCTFNTDEEIQAFGNFLKHKHKGYYAYFDGQCALRIWIFMTADRCLVGHNFMYDLPDNEAFLGWSQTHPDYRRLGLFSIALEHAISDNPGKTISGYVESSNIASLKGTSNAGFETMERYTLMLFWRFGLKIKTYEKGKGNCWKPSLGRTIKPLS